MGIPAYYQKDMARALPGQVSDTSAYNIDGACVLDSSEKANVSIFVGVAVKHGGVDVMGNKIIKPISSAGDHAYGVAIRSHFQTTGENGRMVYENGSGINVMTEGRVWMISKDAVAPQYDTPIKIESATGFADTAGGDIETEWVATGDFTKFQDLNLIEVKLFGA